MLCVEKSFSLKGHSMKLRKWPNGIGWDYGRAEVRDCVSFLRVFVPMNSRPKQPDRHRRMDFPLGTDPVMAVALCAKEGSICLD